MNSDPPDEPSVGGISGVGRSIFLLFGLDAAVFETIAVVTCFHNVAMMRESVEQRRGHLGIPKHVGPFREAQVGRDDDAGALVELAEQVEQQGATGLTKG